MTPFLHAAHFSGPRKASARRLFVVNVIYPLGYCLAVTSVARGAAAGSQLMLIYLL